MALSTFEIMWNEKEMGVVENEKRVSEPRTSTPYSLPNFNWRPSIYNLPRADGLPNGERQPLLPRYERVDSEQHLLSPEARPETARLDVLYDIFFVSVISLFTYANGLDDGKAVKHFLAFFALLWTTWYQVTLHRSTFSPNDIFATILQICQLGVLCLFAAYGLYSQHGLGLALALSRVVLVMQYSQSWLFTHNTRQRERQLGFVVAVKAVALLSFVVADMHGLRGLWYWIAAVETVVDTAVSFAHIDDDEQSRREGLFSRISNLTLVVLGSGILALGKGCFDLGAERILEVDIRVAGNVLCFFAIIYTTYALQSSSTQQPTAAEKRGALWALLHFPLHFALFLGMAPLAPALLRVEESSTQPSVALFSFGAVTVLIGLLHLSSKQLRQINSREVASAVLLVIVGISIMHSSNSMTVSEGAEELLAVWALPVVVLKLGFVLVVDKVWGRANRQMAEEEKECVTPSLAWWSHTSFMGSW